MAWVCPTRSLRKQMWKKIWGNLFAFPLRKRKRNKISWFSIVIISVQMVTFELGSHPNWAEKGWLSLMFADSRPSLENKAENRRKPQKQMGVCPLRFVPLSAALIWIATMRKAPDTFKFLRHVMRAIRSVRPKCSHRCVSLKETPLKPVQTLNHTTKNSAEQTAMRTKWLKHIAI